MDLTKIFMDVAYLYDESQFINVEQEIFNVMQQYSGLSIDNSTSVLFMEKGKICYRKVFETDSYGYVFNKYGFKEAIKDVVGFQGDPVLLKKQIKEFIYKLKGDESFGQISAEETVYPKDKAIHKSKTAEQVSNYALDATKKANNRNNIMKDVLDKMIEVNKASAVNTAKVELGKTANKLVLSKITPQLPMMVRGYADSPLAELVVANVVAGLLLQFAPNNDKAKVLSEAMISAGAQVAIESFDIPGIINELLANVDVTGLDAED